MIPRSAVCGTHAGAGGRNAWRVSVGMLRRRGIRPARALPMRGHTARAVGYVAGPSRPYIDVPRPEERTVSPGSVESMQFFDYSGGAGRGGHKFHA